MTSTGFAAAGQVSSETQSLVRIFLLFIVNEEYEENLQPREIRNLGKSTSHRSETVY